MITFKMKPSYHQSESSQELREKVFHIYNKNSTSLFNKNERFILTWLDGFGSSDIYWRDREKMNHVYYNSSMKLVRLININNQNARYEKILFKSGARKGELKEYKLIQKKQWLGYTYDIPLELFKHLTQNGRYRIRQHNHHFTFEDVNNLPDKEKPKNKVKTKGKAA